MTVLRNELGEDKGTPTAVSFGDERLIGTEAEKHLQVIRESRDHSGCMRNDFCSSAAVPRSW